MLQEGLSAIEELEAQLSRWQLQRLLGGPYDEGDAVLSIQASTYASDGIVLLKGPHMWVTPKYAEP